MRIQRGWGTGGRNDIQQRHNVLCNDIQKIAILVRTPENHKAFKPAFNVGHHRNASEMPFKVAFRWRANDSPVVF